MIVYNSGYVHNRDTESGVSAMHLVAGIVPGGEEGA